VNIDKLKVVIQQANPEIMELKFGCEIAILFDDSDFYGKVKPEWVKRPIYSVSAKKAVVYIVDPPFPNNAIDVQDSLDKGEFKILGRPIRLADVLVAAENKIIGDYIIDSGHLTFMKAESDEPEEEWTWNLLDDNLDNQSDECKKFLTELLVK
jgi:hypothetical protein